MNYTIGQVISAIAVMAGVITSLGVILAMITKFLKWYKKNRDNPILSEMANMESRIMDEMKKNDIEIGNKIDLLAADVKTLDVNQCKDVIVNYISALEQGQEIDPIAETRAFEAMERYTNVLKQNSYIHKRWEDVMENR